jgi:hypothetical protein
MLSYLYSLFYSSEPDIKWDEEQRRNKYLVNLQIKVMHTKTKRAHLIKRMFDFTINDQIRQVDYLNSMGKLEDEFKKNEFEKYDLTEIYNNEIATDFDNNLGYVSL